MTNNVKERVRTLSAVKCGEHNHPLLIREVAHPSHRKMTNDVKERVRILSLLVLRLLRS